MTTNFFSSGTIVFLFTELPAVVMAVLTSWFAIYWTTGVNHLPVCNGTWGECVCPFEYKIWQIQWKLKIAALSIVLLAVDSTWIIEVPPLMRMFLNLPLILLHGGVFIGIKRWTTANVKRISSQTT